MDATVSYNAIIQFHTTLSFSGADATLIDADGTQRVFTETGPESFIWGSPKEVETLTGDGTDYTLTRCNGDKWVYGQASGVNQNKLKSIVSRTGDTITVTRNGTTGLIETITDSEGRETKLYYVTYGSSITRLQEFRKSRRAMWDTGSMRVVD